MANGRCRNHGGAALKGAQVSTFVHGRRSKYMPKRLLAKYEEARADPDLLAMDDEIALVDARLGDLLQRADSGDAGAIWIELRARWREYARYERVKDLRNMASALHQLHELIEKGFADHATWSEIGTLIDRRGRLVEQERRRLESLQNTMTVDDAIALARALDDVLARHITDPAVYQAILLEVGGLLTVDAPPIHARSVGRSRRR
jgi:hypothetical protein